MSNITKKKRQCKFMVFPKLIAVNIFFLHLGIVSSISKKKEKKNKITRKFSWGERKRHTVRRVASTPSAVLAGRGGGLLHPVLARGYPILTCAGLALLSPTSGTGVSPRKGHGPGTGIPPSPQKRHGTSGWKYYGMEMGNPSPVDRHTPVKTVPSPFLWNTGGKKDQL